MADPAELIARLLRANDRYDPLKEGDSGRAEYEAAYSALLAALTPPSPASIASAEAEKVLDAYRNELHMLWDGTVVGEGSAEQARAAVLARMDRRAVIEECARVAEAQTASCDLDTPGGHGCDYFVRNTVVPAIRALADKETGK